MVARLCVTVDAQKDSWRRHFKKVLNVVSVFDVFVFNRVKQRPVHVAAELASLPCKLEIVGALGKLRYGKASGASISCQRCWKDNKLFVLTIQDLMKSVWEERAVPKE